MQPVDGAVDAETVACIMHAFMQSEEYLKYCTTMHYGGPEAAYAIVENFVREMAT